MIDWFNRKKLAELEKRLKAVEVYLVDKDIQKKENERNTVLTLSDDQEGEPWLTKS